MRIETIFTDEKYQPLCDTINNHPNDAYKILEPSVKSTGFLKLYEKRITRLYGYPRTSQNAMIWELISMAKNGYAYRDKVKLAKHQEWLERRRNQDPGLPCYATQDHSNPGYC